MTAAGYVSLADGFEAPSPEARRHGARLRDGARSEGLAGNEGRARRAGLARTGDSARKANAANRAGTARRSGVAKPTRQARMNRVFRLISVLCFALGFVIIAVPYVQRALNEAAQAQVSSEAATAAESWPTEEVKAQLDAAQAYNERLAASGQSVIGEVTDPFLSAGGSSAASDAASSASAQDSEYQGLLDTGQGVMGSVRIPKIDANLPIYHGTSEAALAQGAGHLYGTSLPVGGQSTHAVITGHRGVASSLLFTRLDELEVGDSFYIEVLGEELGYKIDRIDVVEPTDDSWTRVTEGEDRVTLMTCTPYGVNSHRLLVSAVRAEIPDEVPASEDVAGTNTTALVLAGLVAVLVAVVVVGVALLVRRRRRERRRAFASGSRWRQAGAR